MVSLTRAGEDRVNVAGALVFEEVTSACEPGMDLIVAGSRTTFDLSGVDRSDSAGVALLLEWRRCAMERQAVLEFDGVPAQLRTIAATSNLEGLFEPAATGTAEVSAAGSAA